jgi:hypothetical protein
MSKKILVLALSLCLSSCLLPEIEKPDAVSLKMINKLENNQGNLIELHIKSQNYPNPFWKDEKWMCEQQTMIAFTFTTPKKAPKKDERRTTNEFRYAKNLPSGGWELRGHYEINKKDIYLIHKGKKIAPTKIFIAQTEYDFIESTNVAYSNFSEHATQFLTFPIPCTSTIATETTPSDTKLIIAKIYKDDKIIKQNLEFKFIKSKDNKIYSIWLE